MRFLIDDGRVLTGTYGYSDRYVTVKTVHGSKITQRGRLPPESLARIMLREPLASVFASGRYAGAICIAASLASSSQGEAAGALQALALKAAPSERAAS